MFCLDCLLRQNQFSSSGLDENNVMLHHLCCAGMIYLTTTILS